MGLRDRIETFFGEGFPVVALEPYRRAGGDAYELIDETPAASWARLAAWNAYFLQVYADHLCAAATSGRYVELDGVPYIRGLYEQANVWIAETRQALASDSYRFAFHLPSPLPHWRGPYRTDAELVGMLTMLEVGRVHVAFQVRGFTGDDVHDRLLRVRLAEIDAKATSTSLMWTPRASDPVRGRLGDKLCGALDDVYELGQMLAQPELMKGLF